MTTPWVALETIAFETSAGVADGLVSRYRAATPVTCGVAIEVPLIVLVAVSPVAHAEVMLTPGENRSTQLPMLAHEGFPSAGPVALTVSAAATRAGDVVQAFTACPRTFPLPAAIA